jgi:hypothetical protein
MSTHHEHDDVQVTALYTQTARKATFTAEQDQTVQQVIDEAYRRLGESRRAGDQYFCHQEPRVDLSPYLGSTLRSLQAQGICFHASGHDRLEFAFDIDAEPGGAA